MKTFRVKVTPNAREDRLERLPDGSWIAQVRAPPVDGKANVAVAALIAAHLSLRKGQVRLKSGASARVKLFQIDQ
jgi:uncharacterized protein YggU (UPF0235/DUF167 family)